MSSTTQATRALWHCVRCGLAKSHPHTHGRLFLVRHGQTDFNKHGKLAGHVDIPLNEEGIEQAKQAAELLRDKKIDLIISSDLLRAKMTAEIIAQATGAEIQYDHRIRERNFGEAERLDKEEFKAAHPIAFSDYEYRIPQGESFADLEARVAEALTSHRTHRHKNIVQVSHGGVLRMVFKLIREWSRDETMKYPGAPNSYPFEIEISDPCPQCGSDLYEDPEALEEFTAKRTNDPIYQKTK